MAFVRWDPLQDLLALHERMNRLAGADAPGWSPPVDIYETAGEYVVTAELPGMGRDDIQIQVREGKLVVKGVRPSRNAACEQYHRVERGRGSFSRTFTLPAPIEIQRVTADLRDGVLTITIPKSGSSPRRIEVS
jgi:HSP20 family protein